MDRVDKRPERYCIRLILMAVVASLLGCSTVPSQVAMPSPSDKSSDSALQPYIGRKIGLTRESAMENVMVYEGTWRKRESELRMERDLNANFGVISAVFAAISGVRGRVHDAKIGTALAGGSALISTTYHPETLAAVYGSGADAMNCVSLSLQGLSPSIDLLYTGGVLNVARSEVSTVGNDNAAAAWDKFATLWMDIGASIHVIATKVLKSAASQTVTVPKVSDLTSKLSDALKAQSDAAAQAQSSKAAVNQAEQQLSEGQKTWNSVSEAAKTYALALRARLAVCEATLGS